MDIRVYPPEEMIEATVKLPLSKSISNRALIMNALCPCPISSMEVANCTDTAVMLSALQPQAQGPQPVEINVGLAGTAMRFLAAYFAATAGCHVLLDGNERMRHRPIGVLVEALRSCGADINYAGEEGFPPLEIKGKRLHGCFLEMDATVSSQFISGLLMVAPTFDGELLLTLNGEISSLPYLKMTVEMMSNRGISIEHDRNRLRVVPGQYLPYDRDIERDWSAASYWYEIAAMSAGFVTLEDMRQHSLQGDSALVGIYEKLGAITAFEDGNAELSASPEVFSRLDLDLADTPDLTPALAVTCCMLGVPFRFTGLKSLKIKETDRLAALQAELAKLSFVVDIERGETLQWEGARVPIPGVLPIDTYGDHRMAMAFAPVGLFVSGIVIRDAEVVDKSYPDFWRDMQRAGFEIKTVE